ELQAEDVVARVGERHQHRSVGLGTGVRLHVRVGRTEQRLGAVAGEVLGHVDVFASAVVAATGVTLCVLVGQHGALRFEHGTRDEVLARDHLEGVALAAELLRQDGGDLGVDALERIGERGGKFVVQELLLRAGVNREGRRATAGALAPTVSSGPGERPIDMAPLSTPSGSAAPRWLPISTPVATGPVYRDSLP